MNLNTVLSLIVAGLIVVGGYAFTHGGIPGPQGLQGPQGVAGQDGSNGANGKNGSNGEQSFGAASAPALNNGCLDMGGGSFLCTVSQAFKPNASTTCAIKSGLASSTLVRATARVINPRGGTFDLEIGKSATIMATTTSLGRLASIAIGTTVTASSSPQAGYAGAQSPFNFNAGDILNFKVGSSTHNITGVCSAMFMSI